MSYNLPDEIVEAILLRCSPKCVITFKRVCKSWLALITDSSFARKHLRTNAAADIKRPSSSVNLVTISAAMEFSNGNHSINMVNSRISFCTAEDNNGGGILPCVVEELDFPRPEMGFRRHLVSSHCDGIVCLVVDGDAERNHTILLNPTLGEFKRVCRPSDTPEFRVSASGFGYDSRASDYKYVEVQGRSSLAKVELSRAMVYAMGSDSWREIEIDLRDEVCVDTKGVYREGVYYWACLKRFDSAYFVLSFDFSEEVFKTVLLPNCFPLSVGSTCLELWNEQIAFFFFPAKRLSMPIEMWVMAENCGGVEGSTCWTKHLTIEPPESIYFENSLAFWKDDELLFSTGDSQIVSYNLTTRKIRKLSIPGVVKIDTYDAHIYTPSLVSVNTRNAINR